jgi:ribonuclease HII
MISGVVELEELRLKCPLYEFDEGFEITVVGTDETGRGSLVGDVFAAAVVLDRGGSQIVGLNDSKKLTEQKRIQLYDEITLKCKAYAVARASVAEIDELNILHASLLAMKRAYQQLSVNEPHILLADGNKLPPVSCEGNLSAVEYVIKGDGKSAAIAAASVLAKVARDRYMLQLDERYPEYGFAKHKGYGTKLHNEMLLKHGACEVHRKSFLRKVCGHEYEQLML